MEYGRPLYFVALSFVLSVFFPRLISAVADWMSAILPHMVWHCGLSANLRCRSETCFLVILLCSWYKYVAWYTVIENKTKVAYVTSHLHCTFIK